MVLDDTKSDEDVDAYDEFVDPDFEPEREQEVLQDRALSEPSASESYIRVPDEALALDRLFTSVNLLHNMYSVCSRWNCCENSK